MAAGFHIARDPKAEVRTRRALDQLAKVLNDLLDEGSIVYRNDGKWTLVPSNVTLIDAVFGQKTFLPALPDASNGLPILAGRVFSQRVSYGNVG